MIRSKQAEAIRARDCDDNNNIIAIILYYYLYDDNNKPNRRMTMNMFDIQTYRLKNFTRNICIYWISIKYESQCREHWKQIADRLDKGLTHRSERHRIQWSIRIETFRDVFTWNRRKYHWLVGISIYRKQFQTSSRGCRHFSVHSIALILFCWHHYVNVISWRHYVN